MTPKGLFGFAIVTLVVIVAAGFSLVSRYSTGPSGESTDRLFPALSDKVNDVDEIVFQDAKQTLTLKRSAGNTWSINERGGYPADPETIRNFLVGLAELREGEPKTDHKDRYPRIGVEDVTEKNAKSKLYRVKAGDKELAALIVGRDAFDVAGAAGVGRYVRRLGEQRAWLAKGKLTSPDSVKTWVDPKIMHVATTRLTTVNVVQPDGKSMKIERVGDAKSRKFKILDLAPTATVKYPNDVNNVGDGLDRLELEEVHPVGEIKFPADKTIKTRYRTGDGLVVDVRSFEKDVNTFWATFKASVADGIKDPKVAEKAKKEAADINAKVTPWVFGIPAYKYRYMARRLDEVLEKPKKKKDDKS